MTRIATIMLAVAAAACTSRGAGPTLPTRALEQAQSEARAGRTDAAIAGYRSVLSAEPENLAAMRGLVEAHYKAGRIGAMAGELQRAVAARPEDPVARYGLALALFTRSSDLEGACAQLERAAALRPTVAEYPFRHGVLLLEAERFEAAALPLARARQLDPSQARHHLALATALARTGDRAGAVASIRAILDLAPTEQDLAVARGVMARLHDPFREFPKAIEGEFQRGLELLEKADAPQQAIVAFEDLLERFPDLAVVHAALGLAHLRLDDAGRAMDALRRALELAPEDPRNHLYVADVYFARAKLDRAAEGYRAAVERDPLSDHAYERLSQVALQRADLAEAVRSLQRLVVLRPSDLSARLALGSTLLTQADFDGAERELGRVLEREPQNVEALLRLGQVWAARAQREPDRGRAREHASKAAGYFERVLDLQPQNAFAARLLQSVKP